MTPPYKIFGERNSGTNLTKYLIGEHLFYPDDTGLSSSVFVNQLAMQIGRGLPRFYDNIYDLATQKRHRKTKGFNKRY